MSSVGSYRKKGQFSWKKLDISLMMPGQLSDFFRSQIFPNPTGIASNRSREETHGFHHS